MSSDRTALVERVTALYQRLQANQLAQDDLISIENVKLPDYADTIEDLYRSRVLFEERFKNFIPTFDIFRVFRDESSVVLDVGAHQGYSAIAMRWHGCASKIVAFDVMPSNALCLARIKEIEGRRYDYVLGAVGRAQGSLRMYMPVMNGVGITGIASTGGTLSESFAYILAQQAESYQVRVNGQADDVRVAIFDMPAHSLDEVYRSRGGAEKIVAIKMDIEGHEGPAVEGAAHIFTTMKPLLMIEGANRDSRVCKAMQSYGYFHCERHNGVLFAHVDMSMSQDGFWIHPERVEEYKALGIFEGPVA